MSRKVFPRCRDKHDTPLKFGDEVYYYIPGHSTPGGYGFIIGVMSYAVHHEDIVCLAGPSFIGMPINTAHLERTSSGHTEQAMALREAYLKKAPSAFKPLPEPEPEPSSAPRYYWERMAGWEGDFVTYAPLTTWASRGDWIVPGTWRDAD